MKTARHLEEIASRMEAIERELAKIETAIIVREPATPIAAESFEGLRKQVLASSRAMNAHLAQLIEFDLALRGGAQPKDLALLLEGWLRQAGVERVFGPVTPELFDEHGEGPGEMVVRTPAYVTDVGDGTTRVLQPGIAVRAASQPLGDTPEPLDGAEASDQEYRA